MLMLAAGSALAAVSDGTLENPATLTWEDLTLTAPANDNVVGTLTASNSGLNWDQNTGNLKSWELSFTLDIDKIRNSYAYLFGTSKDNSGAFGYVLSISKDGYIQLTNGKKSDSTKDLIKSSTSVFGPYTRTESGQDSNGDYTDYIFADGTSIEVTLTFLCYVDEVSEDSVGGEFTLYVDETFIGKTTVDGNANTVFLKNGNSRLWTNSAAQQFSNISIKQGGVLLVPEPATATLSLLALAGLAARRRRRLGFGVKKA